MPRKTKDDDKKKPNGLGTITKLKDGRYRWRVTAGYRKGKQVRVSGTCADKPAAQKAINQAIANSDRGLLAMPDQVTVNDYAKRWMKRQKQWATSTRIRYELHLGYALETLGTMRVQAVRTPHIKDMLGELADREMKGGMGKGRTMASSSLAAVRTVIKAVFKEAHLDGLIHANPAESVKRVKALKTEHPGISLDFGEVARFQEIGTALWNAGRSPLWPALFACVSVGLRRGEVMGLRWQDLDLDKGLMMIRQTLSAPKGTLEIRGTKTDGSTRDILLPASLKAVLVAHRATSEAKFDLLGAPLLPSSPVFTTRDGIHVHPDGLSRALEAVLEWCDPTGQTIGSKKTKKRKESQPSALERRLIGIPVQCRAVLEAAVRAGEKLPKISPHDLRHTAGTLMLRRKVPVEVVSKTLGHSDISMTYRVYRHVLESEKREHVIDLFEVPIPQRVMVSPMVN